MSRVSRFLADLKSYEADHKGTDDVKGPQIRGRTALLLILALLLFLAVFTYGLMQIPMRPGTIAALESMLFAVAMLASALRAYYSRKK
jgi:hypothetical protein